MTNRNGSNRKRTAMIAAVIILAAAALCAAYVLMNDDEQKAAILYQTSFETDYSPFNNNETGLSDIYSDTTAPDGTHSLRYTYPAGFESGYAPDTVWLTFPHEDELWIQFYFKLSDNWEWNPIIQKLVYFRCGDPELERTNHMMGIGYWVEHAAIFGTQFRDTHDSIPFPGGDMSLLPTDTWHKVVLHMKINTPGKYNGIGQIWLNDKLIVDASNILWIEKEDSGGFHTFQLEPIYGGGGPSVKEEMYIYYDDFIMQDAPF
jgi:hypothetical protein